MWIQIWLQQIYSNLLDISITTRLWDCLIAQGSKFIINISLAYIKLYENEIIKCNSVESFLEIFKKRIKFKNDQERSIFRERLIKNSIDINISSKTYSRLTNQYKQIYHNISLKNKASNNNIINPEEIINTNVHISSYTNLNNNTYNDLMEIFKPRNKVDNYEIDMDNYFLGYVIASVPHNAHKKGAKLPSEGKGYRVLTEDELLKERSSTKKSSPFDCLDDIDL